MMVTTTTIAKNDTKAITPPLLTNPAEWSTALLGVAVGVMVVVGMVVVMNVVGVGMIVGMIYEVVSDGVGVMEERYPLSSQS